MIDEPDLIQDELPQLTLTPTAVSSDFEEFDHESPQGNIIPFEPQIAQSPKINDSLLTAPSLQESHRDYVVNFPPKPSDGPQPNFQPDPAEEENRDVSPPDINQPVVSPKPVTSKLKNWNQCLTLFTF